MLDHIGDDFAQSAADIGLHAAIGRCYCMQAPCALGDYSPWQHRDRRM